MLVVELKEGVTLQLGCLQALAQFIQNNPLVHSQEKMQWALQVFQRAIIQPMDLEVLCWLAYSM